MNKASRIAASTILTLGALGGSAYSASALAPSADPAPILGGLIAGVSQFSPPAQGMNPDGSPTGGALYQLTEPVKLGVAPVFGALQA
ncbi:hypothetical protein [Streptomyces sp. LN245]|uniref:hypothetical protein n=1 Tax=Streptomyces sp. LN245 TaxID=3112975 RepID=UPI003722E154